MKYIAILLLFFSTLCTAQTVEYKINETEDGFEFIRIDRDASGVGWSSEAKENLDSIELRRLIGVQMEMATEQITKANIAAADARRTKRDLQAMYDSYMPTTYAETVTAKTDKFDGFWRFRYDKQKFEVEIRKGKIRADDVRNGTVEVFSEKELAVIGFNKLDDFKLYEVQSGLMVGEYEGEKVVLKYLGDESKEGKRTDKKN